MQKKILFFDDEEFTTNSLIRNLRNNYSLDITFVSTISKLFEELNNNSDYALIIMDIMVPQPQRNEESVTFSETELLQMSDGIKTGEILSVKIRQEFDSYKNIPILFLTAKDSFTLPHKSAYLKKPELALTIFNKIKELLNEQ